MDKITDNLERSLFPGLPPLLSMLLFAITVFQRLGTLVLLFLVGLALRNLFKMK